MDKSVLFNSLNKKLQFIVNDELNKILTNISNKYNISYDELVEFVNKDNDNNKCIARKQDGLQCTRNKKPNSDYCGKHETNRKYGRIDDNCNIHNDDEDCEKTHIEKISNIDYLVDNDNFVYTNNIENPTLIGKKENNSVVFFNNSN